MANTNKEVESFYDNFNLKLVKDFLTGNARTETAIIHALNWVPDSAENILDIGCGIGWSSYEIGKKYPEKNVVAVDLSQELLNVAKSLFPRENISHIKTDITSRHFLEDGTYDTIILLDVYEHVPKEKRTLFHESLNRILNKGGVVIISCPSAYHQTWLRETNTEGLQPVDENLHIDDIYQFAREVSGDVIYFNYISIWHQYDYFHAVIQKEPDFFATSKFANQSVSKHELEPMPERVKRIKNSTYYQYFQQEIQNLKLQKSKKAGKLRDFFNKLKI